MANQLAAAGDDRRPAKSSLRAGPTGWIESIYARLLAAADIRINGGRAWDMHVHDRRLWRRLAGGGTRALGEAYVEGWWDSHVLDEFFRRLIAARIDRRILNLPKRAYAALAALGNLQSLQRAHRVGVAHYDLDNELYAAMLGPRMVYTCAYWRDAPDLERAQEAKLDLVCRKLQLERGMHVLDIGCGWGGFARYAAERYGVRVTGVTVSVEQADVAREMCRDWPVTIAACDYRAVRGRFDRIVSLGMIEHVGRKNYPTYMRQAASLLDADGLFVLQTIGLNDDASGMDPWVTRYIFPNSEIPALWRLSAAATPHLRVEDLHNFASDYDRTLMAWHANFNLAWPRLAARFDARFKRMWNYYLLMFAGIFRARGLDLWQLVLAPRTRMARYERPA